MNQDMSYSGTSRQGEMFTAFAIGLVAGAVASLLLAPATGEETRRRVGDFARKMGDKAKEGADTAKQYVNEARGRVESAVQEGREAYQRSQV